MLVGRVDLQIRRDEAGRIPIPLGERRKATGEKDSNAHQQRHWTRIWCPAVVEREFCAWDSLLLHCCTQSDVINQNSTPRHQNPSSRQIHQPPKHSHSITRKRHKCQKHEACVEKNTHVWYAPRCCSKKDLGCLIFDGEAVQHAGARKQCLIGR